MGWFNRYIVGSFSPMMALRRERAAAGLKAYYEAADPSRLRKTRSNNASANVTNERSGTKLRELARHFEENFDIASGALDVLTSNTIGPGIIPAPLIELTNDEPADDLNQQLMLLWNDWIKGADVTGQFDAYSLQRIVARTMFRDGECFGQRIVGLKRGLNHGTTLPYSIEAFEPDFVPLDYNEASKNIRQGIEHDSWGRPRRYHRFKQHPGEGLYSYIEKSSETISMNAVNVMHPKLVKRLHQTRGITVFASVISRLDDIKEIDESERVASRVAAAMAAYIKKGTPDHYTSATLDSNGNPEYRELDLVPGMIFDDLLPGEEIGTIDNNRPNSNLISFRDSQLRSVASGLMTSYSSLSKNYNGTYSAQRQELVEQFNVYRALSNNFIYRWCQPVWESFVDAAIASGAVELPSNVDRSTLHNASHTAPPMPWIDPESEVNAFMAAEDRLYESKSSIIRRRGGVPDEVWREIERDNEHLQRRGLTQAASNPETSPEPDDDDTDETVDDVAERTARAVVRIQRRRA